MRNHFVLLVVVILVSGCVPSIKPTKTLIGKQEEANNPSSSHIHLDILEPKERSGVIRNFPVSVGIVFPKGTLKSAPGGVVEDETSYQQQTESIATKSADGIEAQIGSQSYSLLLFMVEKSQCRPKNLCRGKLKVARGDYA
ncbi:MAG: hypothetical protein KAG97_07610 [Victivallales bacterium]|nr:hypothetical protein [Victivallales bacterium]